MNTDLQVIGSHLCQWGVQLGRHANYYRDHLSSYKAKPDPTIHGYLMDPHSHNVAAG